jgi:hypothetical protein
MRFTTKLLFMFSLALSFPTIALGGTYDGRWSVSLVTRSGACDSYRWSIGIDQGKVTDVEGTVGSSIGGINAKDKVKITLSRGSDRLVVQGTAANGTGYGDWLSPTRQCSGTWDARKL